jgi:uncharacterized phage protein gp47/JayE
LGYPFVKWNGEAYVITEITIEANGIENEIGKVTSYSDQEKTQTSGNFSNTFEKGTKYFKIRGVDSEKAIAVEKEKGIFVKAIISDEREKKK